METAKENVTPFLCSALAHRDGGIIGFASGLQPTAKKNLNAPTLVGAWLLRRCSRCGEVYTRQAAADHLGDVVPVITGSATFFLRTCSEGCPTGELYIQESTAGTIAGCNFCGRVTGGRNPIQAIKQWGDAQDERKSKQGEGRAK